jgi:hypothetical protein
MLSSTFDGASCSTAGKMEFTHARPTAKIEPITGGASGYTGGLTLRAERRAISAGQRVKHQLFFGKKLQRAVAFRVHCVPETALNGGKHGDDLATLVMANRVFDFLANCEL